MMTCSPVPLREAAVVVVVVAETLLKQGLDHVAAGDPGLAAPAHVGRKL